SRKSRPSRAAATGRARRAHHAPMPPALARLMSFGPPSAASGVAPELRTDVPSVAVGRRTEEDRWQLKVQLPPNPAQAESHTFSFQIPTAAERRSSSAGIHFAPLPLLSATVRLSGLTSFPGDSHMSRALFLAWVAQRKATLMPSRPN